MLQKDETEINNVCVPVVVMKINFSHRWKNTVFIQFNYFLYSKWLLLFNLSLSVSTKIL